LTGIGPLYEQTVRLGLVSLGEKATLHEALLDAHNHFAFGGVNPGAYALRGEIHGFGDVEVNRIEIADGEDLDMGVLSFRRRPYLRFHLKSARGVPFRRAARISLLGPNARESILWTKRKRPGAADVAVKNEYVGEYRYRVVTRRPASVVEGRVTLNREDKAVFVMV